MPGISHFGQKDWQLRMLVSEALAAGDFVNIYSNSGTPNGRKADAALSREAHAFVVSAYSANTVALLETSGVNMSQSGLTPGRVYLSASTPGRATSSLPSSTVLQQQVGIAISATTVIFSAATAVAAGIGGTVNFSSSFAYPYGSAADGALTLDGVIAAPSGMTKSGSVYTMTRNQSFSDLTVNAGVTLKTVGWAIFGTGTLTCNGSINHTGLPGSGVTAAAGGQAVAGYFNGGGPGGNGGPAAGGGVGAGSVANAIGGAGGAGGASGARGGGAGGTATLPTEAIGGLHFCYTLFAIQSGRIAAGGTLNTGSGGGGSAGDGTTQGNGGGGSGGILGLYFHIIAAASGSVSVAGGDGAQSSVSASNVPGSGGGGGGAILLVTSSAAYASLITFSVAGGAAGLGRGTGPAGSTGSAGRILAVITA